MTDILLNTLDLLLEAAPWLVIGLIAAGLIRAWMPQDRVARWLGGRGFWPVSRAALIGAPLPICSCGVVPVALGLHRAGAPRGPTTSFLIATPETGADSIALSYVLLGPFMMIARPIAAIASGIVTGLGVALAPEPRPPGAAGGRTGRAGSRDSGSDSCGDGCCAGETATAIPMAAAPCDGAPATATRADDGSGTGSCRGGESGDTAPARGASPSASCGRAPGGTEPGTTATCADDCCEGEAAPRTETTLRRTWRGLRYAATDILDDIAVYLTVGLVVAGVTMTFVPPAAVAQWGSGLPAMLAMLVVGVPLYVCATESTPIAAAMLFAGVSPGTVLVFLLAGPATNLGTLAALRREFGTHWLIVYLAGVSVSAIGAGLLVDAIVRRFDIPVAAQVGAAGGVIPTTIAVACAGLLAVLAIRPLRRRMPGFRVRAA